MLVQTKPDPSVGRLTLLKLPLRAAAPEQKGKNFPRQCPAKVHHVNVPPLINWVMFDNRIVSSGGGDRVELIGRTARFQGQGTTDRQRAARCAEHKRFPLTVNRACMTPLPSRTAPGGTQ